MHVKEVDIGDFSGGKCVLFCALQFGGIWTESYIKIRHKNIMLKSAAVANNNNNVKRVTFQSLGLDRAMHGNESEMMIEQVKEVKRGVHKWRAAPTPFLGLEIGYPMCWKLDLQFGSGGEGGLVYVGAMVLLCQQMDQSTSVSAWAAWDYNLN